MNNVELTYNDTGLTFIKAKNDFKEGKENVLRWLKGRYRTKGRIINEYLPTFVIEDMTDEMEDYIMNEFDNVKPFTYTEAFKIDNQTLRSLVFDTIDVAQMVKELGSERIASDGKEVVRKQFTKSGERLKDKTYHNIYHTHKVDITKLIPSEMSGRADTTAYALQCWCTSTNKEHWIWIEKEYVNDPLSAVASTFRIHENLIPHIKELKRQGDILLVEMEREVEPEGEIVPLTKEQYFELLTSES